jgi:sodium-dependent dicarboxylate transporter 2/3/5
VILRSFAFVKQCVHLIRAVMIPVGWPAFSTCSNAVSGIVRAPSNHMKHICVIFVLLLGLLGYLLGPKDLALGDYRAQIDVRLGGQNHSVAFPFVLGQQAGEPAVITSAVRDYQISIEGKDVYPHQLDQCIAYRVRMIDSDGNPTHLTLDSITSTIVGTDYRQVLPPIDRSGEWLVFSMRIPYKARICTALLFVVGALWLTEVVPLSAGALLIPIVIVVAGVTDPGTVFEPFFHPIVVLFLAGFLLAEGMRRTGVDRMIALNILKRSSLEPAGLMFTMMLLTAFLSLWMSNTASVALIIPIALAVLNRIPSEGTRTGFRRALILGVAYAATVGGIGSAIGTPANVLALTFLNELSATNFAFIDWFAYGLPLVVTMLPIIWLYLILAFRVELRHVGAHLSHDVYERELTDSGGLGKEQRWILLVFVAVMGLWLTERWHHLHTSIVALGGVLVLFFTETIKREDLNRINWDALLTFGGGLAIGKMLVITGVSDWVALHLMGLSDLPTLLVVFLVAGLTMLIGAFISNTGCAAMLIPIAIPLAQMLHIDPRLLVVVIAIASSLDFALVVGTPPTMMAYSTGFFGARDIFKRGVVLDFVGLLILSFGVLWIWQLMGVVTF